jgi:hypothetical protein
MKIWKLRCCVKSCGFHPTRWPEKTRQAKKKQRSPDTRSAMLWDTPSSQNSPATINKLCNSGEDGAAFLSFCDLRVYKHSRPHTNSRRLAFQSWRELAHVAAVCHGPGVPGGPVPQSPQHHPEQRSEGLECGTFRPGDSWRGQILATLGPKPWLINTKWRKEASFCSYLVFPTLRNTSRHRAPQNAPKCREAQLGWFTSQQVPLFKIIIPSWPDGSPGARPTFRNSKLISEVLGSRNIAAAECCERFYDWLWGSESCTDWQG